MARLDTNDNIILVMGLTGAGKSTFINSAVGSGVATIGHGLFPCTLKLRRHVATHPTNHSCQVSLVDTPGFDDLGKTDDQILRLIANWLTDSCQSGAELAGIIYLYEIKQARNRQTLLLDALCRSRVRLNTVLATTKWTSGGDGAAYDGSDDQREAALIKDYATSLAPDLPRFSPDGTSRSAWEIINLVLGMQPVPATSVRDKLLSIAIPKKKGIGERIRGLFG